MNHSHGFDDQQWLFDISINSPVYSTKNVIKSGYPILTISHDEDGDWQFLCGTTNDTDDMSIVCFGCMFEKHPWIVDFHDLPIGWIAWREDENDSWKREQLDQ